MTERFRFEYALVAVAPPWLQRSIGGRFLGAIGKVIDSLVDRAALGVKARFPGLIADSNDALPYIGRDRRIRRGPNETDSTYARRLRIWLDSHRTRGGPYAMLAQLFAYWRAALNMPIDLVYQTGRRYRMDTAGTVVRDDITWAGGLYMDGGPKWARFWLFFYVTSLLEPLTDEFGVPITDEHGDPVTVELLLGDTLPADWTESFSLVPREWNAAHIEQTTIVLLRPGARLLGYPRPVPTFTQWAATGAFAVPRPLLIRLAGAL